ncbi:MAG: OmpA family protein, partial [Rhodobacter sp.]|nr:OmpA family protein [Rhodobacter sp.]
EIESAARDTMDALADQMRKCPDIAMEIGGHTDSQGRDSTNLALSQARAEAVLLGLQGRRVLVGSLTAVGYGETRPLADNDSPSGREINRRIEFTLPGQTGAATDGSAPVQAPGSPGADASAPPAPKPAPRPGGTPAAAAPEPQEPFVSSAPDEPTRRARQRPEAE